jgi:hypothetical protein
VSERDPETEIVCVCVCVCVCEREREREREKELVGVCEKVNISSLTTYLFHPSLSLCPSRQTCHKLGLDLAHEFGGYTTPPIITRHAAR